MYGKLRLVIMVGMLSRIDGNLKCCHLYGWKVRCVAMYGLEYKFVVSRGWEVRFVVLYGWKVIFIVTHTDGVFDLL